MAGWNGSGTFSRSHDWTEDQGNGIKIRADRHDDNDVDFVSGINNTMTKDGQNSATADLNMGGNKLKNGKTATLAGDFPIASNIQNGTLTHVTSTGSANAYVVAYTPTPAAYVAGQTFTFKANFANTGAATVNVNGLGAKAINNIAGTTALAANDIIVDQIVTITYDGTQFQVTIGEILSNPLNPNGHYIGWDKGGDIASASPLVVDTDGNMFDVTGTTGFSVMTVATNRKFTLQFDGILTITNGASIILPGGANFTTAAGDVLECQSIATDTVLVTNIAKADGTPVGGSGSWELLETQTASSSATIDFATDIDSTFRNYAIIFNDISPATDAVDFNCRISIAASFKSGATDYGWSTLGVIDGSATVQIDRSSSAAQIQINNLTELSNIAGEFAHGIVSLHNPSNSASFPMVGSVINYWSDDNDPGSSSSGSGSYKTAVGVMDGIQFFMSSGNIASGTFKLYGIS